jgi:hypothetical protein
MKYKRERLREKYRFVISNENELVQWIIDHHYVQALHVKNARLINFLYGSKCSIRIWGIVETI